MNILKIERVDIGYVGCSNPHFEISFYLGINVFYFTANNYVLVYKSCYINKVVDVDIIPMNPYQPLPFHILSYDNIPVQNFNIYWLKHLR